MLIKLLNKYPIIAVDEARILGQMKGVILEDNCLVGILSSFESEDSVYPYTYKKNINEYIQIPIEYLTTGPDAFIIKESSVANLNFNHGQIIQSEMGIYTNTGEFIGPITGVKIGLDYSLQGIYAQSAYIEAEEIIKIGNVIMIESHALKKDRDRPLENSSAFLDIEEGDEEFKDEIMYHHEKSPMLEESHDEEDENTIRVIEDYDGGEEDREAEIVYDRYRYLLGKKLINSIDVADKTYSVNSIINTELVQSAINNNCILNLIMNAED